MRKKLGLWLVAASLVLGYGTSAEAAEIKNIQPDTGIVFELTDMAKGTPGGDSSGGDQPGVAEPGGPADEGPSEPTTGSDGSVIDAPGGAAGDERPTEEPTTEGPVVEEPTTEKPADKPTEKPDEKPTEEPETVEETKGNDSDKSGLKSDKDKDAVEMATGDAKPAGGIDSSRLMPIIVIIAGLLWLLQRKKTERQKPCLIIQEMFRRQEMTLRQIHHRYRLHFQEIHRHIIMHSSLHRTWTLQKHR